MTTHVKVKPINKRAFWAIEGKSIKEIRTFTRCDKTGTYNLGNKINLFLFGPRDIAWVKPARINKKYAELEVIKK